MQHEPLSVVAVFCVLVLGLGMSPCKRWHPIMVLSKLWGRCEALSPLWRHLGQATYPHFYCVLICKIGALMSRELFRWIMKCLSVSHSARHTVPFITLKVVAVSNISWQLSRCAALVIFISSWELIKYFPIKWKCNSLPALSIYNYMALLFFKWLCYRIHFPIYPKPLPRLQSSL